MHWRRRTWIRSLAAALCTAPAHAKAEAARLAEARQRQPDLPERYRTRGVPYPAPVLFFRAFKLERTLEVWASASRQEPCVLIETIPICAASGTLGPKRREGDLQVPEGAYTFDLYNPQSQFHLSVRVSYPNRSDRIRGEHADLGGDIMIHGGCASIGCIAVRDDPMERVFIAAYDTHRRRRRPVEIHIFPMRFGPDAWPRLAAASAHDNDPMSFWGELEPIYEAFERTRLVPTVRIDATSGAYQVIS